MKDLRRLVGIVLALVVAAFAVPGLGAPQAQSQFSVSLASDPNVPLTVTATITNLGGSNNTATISSFKLTLTGAKIDFTGTTGPSGKVTSADSNSSVIVNQINKIEKNQTYVLTLKLKDCGGAITLTGALAFTGSQQNGNPFVLATTLPLNVPSVSCGKIACGISQMIPSSSYSASVTRSGYDKDGGVVANTCDIVPYTVTVQGAQTHFEWPTGVGGDPAAAFLYQFTGTLSHVAWLPTSGSPVFIAGQPCVAPPLAPPLSVGTLPAPYGVVIADTYTTDGNIEVNTSGGMVARPPTIPTDPPVQFDVVIETERLTVQYDNANSPGPGGGEIWNVLFRNVGNTPVGGPLTPLTFAAGDPVMYTPLPIQTGPYTPAQGAAGYIAGGQAQMCIVQQAGGVTQFIDIGDGFHQP
jgi:hypothetical protein